MLRKLLTPPDPSFDPRASTRMRRFSELLGEKPRVLDVGAGANRARNDAIALDLKHSPEIDCQADAHALPFPDGAFEGVIASALLEHVRDPREVLGEVWRVMEVGGHVFLNVPFMQGYHAEPGSEADYWRFTLPGLRALCDRLV